MEESDKVLGEEDEAFDPDKRELCPDGMCVGVIGPDGRCKVCGKQGTGKVGTAEAAASPRKEKDEAGEAPKESSSSGDWRPLSVPPGEQAAGTPSKSADRPDWERERVPCPDGMCTGIIGRNGRCGTCGKPADWKDRS
jgi:hypothetical protein